MVRLEAREKTKVPEIVILTVMKACVRNRINPRTEPERLTQKFMKELLRQTGYSRFNENIMQIRVRLTGIQARMFSEAERTVIMRTFNELQEPFERHRGSRDNFISYSYVLNKICQLLGIREVLQYLLPPTLAENVQNADRIWKKMCEDLNYEFVPTI